MSDESEGEKPSIKHDHTVELKGVELDALRSSAEHMASMFKGEEPAKKSPFKNEDTTSPRLSRPERGGAEAGETAEDAAPAEDPTAMIDRASLRALTESQEFEATKDLTGSRRSRDENEDATRSIDRGALAHIIDKKSAPKPFGIRKRSKGPVHSGDDPKTAPKLPSIAKLKSTLESISEATAERERPHSPAIKLPGLASTTRPELGAQDSSSAPALKLPTLARPRIDVPEEPAEESAQAPDVEDPPAEARHVDASPIEVPPVEVPAATPPESSSDEPEAEYELESISEAASEDEPAEAQPEEVIEDEPVEEQVVEEQAPTGQVDDAVSGEDMFSNDSEGELESEDVEQEAEASVAPDEEAVSDEVAEEYVAEEEAAEPDVAEPDVAEPNVAEPDVAGPGVEVEEIQSDATSVSQEQALVEADDDALEVAGAGKPWAKNLVILGALMCLVGGVVSVVAAWSTGLPVLLTGVVCVLAGVAFRR